MVFGFGFLGLVGFDDHTQGMVPLLHSSDRSARSYDDPLRFSTLRAALYQYGALTKPAPDNKFEMSKHDWIEDVLRVGIMSPLLGHMAAVMKGGHDPTEKIIWTTPTWANRLLWQARLIRYTSQFFIAGATYYSIYNYLTTVKGWPISKEGVFAPWAPIYAMVPVGLMWTKWSTNNVKNRPMTGLASTPFGRGLMSVFVTAGLATGWARFQCMGNSAAWQGIKFDKEDSFVWQMKHNAPGLDLVTDAPFIPLYKEAKSLPGGVRNPYYDPEYVAKAKAEIKKLVDDNY